MGVGDDERALDRARWVPWPVIAEPCWTWTRSSESAGTAGVAVELDELVDAPDEAANSQTAPVRSWRMAGPERGRERGGSFPRLAYRHDVNE